MWLSEEAKKQQANRQPMSRLGSHQRAKSQSASNLNNPRKHLKTVNQQLLNIHPAVQPEEFPDFLLENKMTSRQSKSRGQGVQMNAYRFPIFSNQYLNQDPELVLNMKESIYQQTQRGSHKLSNTHANFLKKVNSSKFTLQEAASMVPKGSQKEDG